MSHDNLTKETSFLVGWPLVLGAGAGPKVVVDSIHLSQSPQLVFPQVRAFIIGVQGPITFILPGHASDIVLVSTGNRNSKATQLQLLASSSLLDWRQ